MASLSFPVSEDGIHQNNFCKFSKFLQGARVYNDLFDAKCFKVDLHGTPFVVCYL